GHRIARVRGFVSGERFAVVDADRRDARMSTPLRAVGPASDEERPMRIETSDARAVGTRGGRNISEFERWGSMTAGARRVLYGLGRRRGNGWILATFGGLLFRRGFVGHCVTYELFDINTARSETRGALGGGGGINVQESVTIARTPQELYRFWRSLENLPR